MSHKILGGVIAAILCVCFAVTYIARTKDGGKTAEAWADGEKLTEINLQNIGSAYEYPIEQNGHKNILLVEDGQISMKSADCPDKLCVKQGAISNGAYPIVCLPNKIVVKINSGGAADAVSR